MIFFFNSSPQRSPSKLPAGSRYVKPRLSVSGLHFFTSMGEHTVNLFIVFVCIRIANCTSMQHSVLFQYLTIVTDYPLGSILHRLTNF